MVQDKTTLARTLFFDIEATGLVADFGQMLCCGFKWADEPKPFVLSTLDYGEGIGDKTLVKEVVKVINSADIICTYFGKGYDVKFINTRVLKSDDKIKEFIGLASASHIDLWETVKHKLKLRGNRLLRVIEYLELDNEKTPVKGPEWMDAQKCPKCSPVKVKKAMNYIIDHCTSDVLALEEAYNKLKPLIENHPRVLPKPNGKDRCTRCGSDNLQKRGYAVTSSALRKPRLRCSDCGGWSFGGIYSLKEKNG